MRILRRLRFSNLLKLALFIITASGLSIVFMAHQMEKPFIKELTSPIHYQSANLVLKMRERDKKLDILQNDDDFFKDLLNFPTNASRKNTSASQPSLWRKSKSNLRARFQKSERISLDGKEKSGANLDVQSINTSLFDFQLRLTNSSRSFSDVNRQLSESSFESQKQNTFKTPYLSAKKSDKATLSSYSTSNHGNQVTHTTLLRYEAKIKDPTSKIRPAEIQDKETLTLHNGTKSYLKQHFSKVVSSYQDNPKQKIVDDLRDSDEIPKVSSESLEHLKQNLTKAISNYRDNPKPKVTNNLPDPNHFLKAPPKKVKTYLQQDSGKVVSHYQGKAERKNTNNLRDSDQLPKASSKKSISSRPSQHSSNRISNSQVSSSPTSKPYIQNVNQHLNTSTPRRKSLLIFGDDRSGTTFVTKMFAADPQMFTVYEPLWVTKKWFDEFETETFYQERVVRDVLNALLSCKFTHFQAGKDFLGHTRTAWVGGGVFQKNVFRTSAFSNKTKTGRSYYPSLARHPKFAENACLNKFNHSVVKVGQVRVPHESISLFIPRVFRDNSDTDIRVIQIVRDPRGSINSRIRSGWISDFTYTGFPKSVRDICYKILANIKFGRGLKSEWLKERYLEVTYRQIATMPITSAKNIYKFAGFQMPDSLIDWIVRSTNPDQEQLQEAIDNPYSHVRDSSKNYFKWRKESPIKRVRVIEQQCKELLDLLGLEPIADEMEILHS